MFFGVHIIDLDGVPSNLWVYLLKAICSWGSVAFNSRGIVISLSHLEISVISGRVINVNFI
jgi:hypothetical protein